MTVCFHPAEIRRLVSRVFDELGVSEDDLAGMDETLMVDRGKYVARNYRLDEYFAMWLIQVGVIQFYGQDGAMLRTVNLFEELTVNRAAA